MYTNLLKIGDSQAEVFHATNVRTGEGVALRQLAINDQNKRLLAEELRFLREHRHPNILRFCDALLAGDKLWIGMEDTRGACLTDILEQFEHGVQMTEQHIAWVCQETLQGLAYLHSLGHTHG